MTSIPPIKPKLFSLVTLQSMLSDLSHLVALERLGPRITERILWHVPTREAKLALTFDDGPDREHTPRLLEILARHGAPATFFFVGRHVEAHFSVAQAVADAGHELGNHTFSHPLLVRLRDEEVVEELTRTDALLRTLNHARPRYMRPPMGLFSRRILDLVQQLDYRAVVGDVYPRDPHLPGADKIVRRVLRRVRRGSIIILHDGGNSHFVDRRQTLAAVDRLIPRLRERGYRFVTLTELVRG